MPTIVMASSKGGCGKSTCAVVLATELALRGTDVTIIDVDPNQPISRWAEKPGKPETLTVLSGTTEDTLLDDIEYAEQETAFVVVDLEGSANLAVALAMSKADLVIIPMKGSHLDATEAVKVIKFLHNQERAYRREIPYTLLYNHTNPAIRSRTLTAIERDFRAQGIPVLQTPLHERDAYRALFAFGGTLSSLDPLKVGGLAAAAGNAKMFVTEVVKKLSMLHLQQGAA
jgi:chromosome partitioning protein